MTAQHQPWCQHHHGREPEDPTKDPWEERQRQKAKKKAEREAKKLEKKKDDDDKNGDGNKKTRGLGMPAWMNSFLGKGALDST